MAARTETVAGPAAAEGSNAIQALAGAGPFATKPPSSGVAAAP